jgi:hypothetical protein
MKHLARTSLALGFALMTPVLPLMAQAPALASAETFAWVGTNPAIEAKLEAAHRMRMEGRTREALRELTAAARAQVATGTSAAQTLWEVAEIQYSDGRLAASARTLDRVAREAEKFGDPVLQARALFEAAVQYSTLGQHGEAALRMERLEPLLESPFIGSDLKSQISARGA